MWVRELPNVWRYAADTWTLWVGWPNLTSLRKFWVDVREYPFKISIQNGFAIDILGFGFEWRKHDSTRTGLGF